MFPLPNLLLFEVIVHLMSLDYPTAFSMPIFAALIKSCNSGRTYCKVAVSPNPCRTTNSTSFLFLMGYCQVTSVEVSFKLDDDVLAFFLQIWVKTAYKCMNICRVLWKRTVPTPRPASNRKTSASTRPPQQSPHQSPTSSPPTAAATHPRPTVPTQTPTPPSTACTRQSPRPRTATTASPCPFGQCQDYPCLTTPPFLLKTTHTLPQQRRLQCWTAATRPPVRTTRPWRGRSWVVCWWTGIRRYWGLS